MLQRVWEDVPSDAADVAATAAALGVPSVIARLLCQRGLGDPERAHAFLHPDIARLHDPLLLTGVREAVQRIMRAAANHERIVIHGDYDVDGITSTVMLRRGIEMVGGNVGHFVPDRHRDGYGLQPATIERLHAEGARLIVSVDCGIRASEAARRARDLGVDLIITDHHEPEAELPPALAVLNPKRADCAYPDKNLAGVGVALKLVQALMTESGRGADALPHFLKIAAIGTLADVVPLVGENRIIARVGLAALSRGPNGTGLEALLQECGLAAKILDSFHVGFIMAPRLNAAGRMGSADAALDLLLLRGRDDATRAAAAALARQLSDENTRRQAEEAAIVAEAKHIVEGDPDVGGHNLLLVSGDGWHRGVIGIVASKLSESYHKPSLVLSVADGIAHGSGRSISGFDLLEALESCRDVFLKFGGHRQAAGVTLEAARIPELRKRLTAWADERLSPNDLMPRLRIDSPLGLRDISTDVLQGLTNLGPFGSANPKPVFRAGPIDLVNPPRRMKERHLSMLVRQDGRSFRAVAWRAADREPYLNANPSGLELAYSLEQGEYRGEKTTELTVADVAHAGRRAMRWQKVARVVVAAIGLAGAVAIYYYSRSRPAPTDPPKSLATIGSNVAQTTDACHQLLSRPSKSNVVVDCASSETLTDGRIRLKQVVISGLNGSRFVLRGDLLETTMTQLSKRGLPAHIAVTGHVKMTTDDGLELVSDSATYDDAAGQFVMPGPMTFTKGRLSGDAVGATYDSATDIIRLLDKASARVAADPSGHGTANATATRMNLKRGQHMLAMEGGVRVVGDTQTMTGNDATWTFTDDEQAVKYVELRGAARVFPNVRGNTNQATMNADNITMTFRPDGLTLQHSTLTGSASLEMAGSAPRTIRASLIDFFLAPDGRLVTRLDAKDQVTVTLAATPTTSGRTITATTLSATGDDAKGLTRAQFDGNPIFRQVAAPVPARGAAAGSAAGSRRGSAVRLVLTLGGQIDAIEFAEFQQNATFDDGDIHGEADVAKYDEAKQKLYLTPNDREPRKLSSVKMPDMKVDARTIDVATESQDLTANGAVITRTTPKASGGGAAGSLFGGKDDIIGSAESLVYTKETGRAVYRGSAKAPAKLWQGTPEVRAEEIEYFDATQKLTAKRGVNSTWELEPAAGDKPGSPVKTYKVRADTLTYDDAARTAVYEGSTVYLHSADGDIEARKMMFQLAAKSRTLDEMRAEQDVYAQLAGGYEAAGEVLVFHADKDAYSLFGKPDRVAVLKSPASKTDTTSTTTPQCTLSRSMQIDLDRRTGAVQQPGDGEAPKPSTPIACTEPIRRSR